MGRAIARALALRVTLGIVGTATERDIDEALCACGMEIVEREDIGGNLRGAIVGRAICIRSGMAKPWRKATKAHEFGHVMLHTGSQIEQRDEILYARQEREADEFALAFVLGTSRPPGILTAAELADHAELPHAYVTAWLGFIEHRLFGLHPHRIHIARRIRRCRLPLR